MRFIITRNLAFAYWVRFWKNIFAVEVPPLVSVTAIIEKQGKLLALNHTYIKGFGLPGGLVRSGEDTETALKREVMEETGLEVTSLSYFGSAAGVFKGIPTLTISYRVNVSGNLKSSDEGGLNWMDLRELLGKMAYENAEKILRMYVSRR